ncbi:GAD-like domain-containing protein [Stenotrophomonas sp. 24(2023)]|uniref:GAD-like domain-containing protein n=1 Tax=Stenotrophomonas sp. 24(2023) TaxID=3068324 RepID=UPI0027E105EF|nr:GAD-like domain-containing protein [Stenotrophomonas sp. 24(2023)]WMJ67638.1 GAD-like domain-containing protein [Stenotrophomonas sp. 24(2023)]
MIKMVDEDFELFYSDEGFGPAVDARPVPPSTLQHYRGKVPDKLLEYWQAYGFAGYGEGRFWMTDPDDYAEVLNAWLYGTEFHGQDDYYVIGRKAFGDLTLWGTKTGRSLTINCPWAMIFPTDQSRWMNAGEEDLLISGWLAVMTLNRVDQTDDKDVPLFDRAVKLLGPLAHDEMYGFVPALAMGGPCRLDHLKKVKAAEHLMFLAQLGERRIMVDIVKEAKNRGR